MGFLHDLFTTDASYDNEVECDHEWVTDTSSYYTYRRSIMFDDDGEPFIGVDTVKWNICEKCNERERLEQKEKRLYVSIERVEEQK